MIRADRAEIERLLGGLHREVGQQQPVEGILVGGRTRLGGQQRGDGDLGMVEQALGGACFAPAPASAQLARNILLHLPAHHRL